MRLAEIAIFDDKDWLDIKREVNKYASLLNDVNHERVKGTISKTTWEKFCNFFKLYVRTAEVRADYYHVFQKLLSDFTFNFLSLLDELDNGKGIVEASFASKMIAIFDTSKPIYDSHVRRSLGLPDVSHPDFNKRKEKANSIYCAIKDFYKKDEYEEIRTCLREEYDSHIKDIEGVSPNKEIDFMLWAIGGKEKIYEVFSKRIIAIRKKVNTK